uniref:(northern house mosquito) hypothetical protein n=1 Tax=Culex pipiens TaxID=7175 RepID=A0A8D8DPN0_CULPI
MSFGHNTQVRPTAMASFTDWMLGMLMLELGALFACWMGTTRGVLSYILVTIPGGGNSARTGLSLFSGLFNLLFSTEFAQFPSPSSPSPALVPTKQSRPEHGAARILPFEIGRKILLAQTKNLLLFLHSGSNTELLLLLQSPRRGGLTDCARSLAAALSQNSTRSRRASRSHNVLLLSSLRVDSLSLFLAKKVLSAATPLSNECCQCVNQIATIAQIGNTACTFARRFVCHFYHSAFSLTQSLFLPLSLSPSTLGLLLPLPSLLPSLIMQSAAARFFFAKNTLSRKSFPPATLSPRSEPFTRGEWHL